METTLLQMDGTEVSQSELMNIILERKGTTIISFTSITEPKLKKTCPFQGVRKHSYVNGMIGYNYQNSVNLQREREGKESDFQAEARAWGERLTIDGKPTPFVEHKGNHYLTVKVERAVQKPRYFDASGNEIPASELEPYFYAQGQSRQELDKEVIPRDYKLESLVAIRLGGVRYELSC